MQKNKQHWQGLFSCVIGKSNYKCTCLSRKSSFENAIFFPVIKPVSAESKVIISKDNNLAMPKLFADISLEEIDILLSRQQVSYWYKLFKYSMEYNHFEDKTNKYVDKLPKENRCNLFST